MIEVSAPPSHSAAAALVRRLHDVRFIRFLVVGVVNTIFGLSLLYFLMWLTGSPQFGLILATIISVLFNFLTLGSWVFRALERRRLARFLGVYGLVYIYNALGLAAFQAAHFDPKLATLALLPGAVLLPYFLNRSLVFRPRDTSVGTYEGSPT